MSFSIELGCAPLERGSRAIGGILGGRANLDVLRGKRVLVVEDEALSAFELTDMLKRWGCQIIGPADRLGRATNLARTTAPDAAILDVRLRDGLSYPLARRLMKDGIPFVFATAYAGDPSWPQEFHDVPCIAKPYSQRALLAALAGVLSQADAQG